MKKLTLPKRRRTLVPLDDGDFKKRMLATLMSLRDGDFSARLPADWVGLDGKVADALNGVAVRMQRSNESLLKLRNDVGRKGRIGERLPTGDAVGGWEERIEAI